MKTTSSWRPLELTRIQPGGWIREFLQRQRDGLTGNLEAAGYPFNTEGWCHDRLALGDRGGSGWWPYEQVAYWVDGMIRCGILLDDAPLKAKARRQIDHVLAHPDPDGYLGPDAMKTLQGDHGSERWPHAVFFRAIMADYDERPRTSTLRALTRHYLSNTAPHSANRNVCNLETMAWLYERTGDARIRDLAETCFKEFQQREHKDGATLANMRKSHKIGDHGPRHMELFKMGAILHRMTGNRTWLEASMKGYRKLKRDHVLIDGVPSSTEHLRGVYSNAGHETCVISDFLWSLGHLLASTGEASIADDMERICFNALPGAVLPDFTALQYFSGPNQVIAGPQTNHHPHGIGCAHISYRPNPATECCPGNVHRAMPAYAGRMWMEDGQGGLMAALYGASTCVIGKGKDALTVRQETDYPFSDRITFHFATRTPSILSFTLRIPGWCRRAAITLNGKPVRRTLRAGTFVTIRRAYKDGDRIDVHLPMKLRAEKGPEQSVGFTLGPLVMALPIKEKRTVVDDKRSTKAFPAWTIEPESPWNYGVGTTRTIIPPVRITAGQAYPFDPDASPLCVDIHATRIAGWRLIRKRKLVLRHGDKVRIHEGNLVFMPLMPEDTVRAKARKRRPETITLVPYGATRLRITWFPVLAAPSG